MFTLIKRGGWLKTIELEDGFLAETLTRFDYVDLLCFHVFYVWAVVQWVTPPKADLKNCCGPLSRKQTIDLDETDEKPAFVLPGAIKLVSS